MRIIPGYVTRADNLDILFYKTRDAVQQPAGLSSAFQQPVTIECYGAGSFHYWLKSIAASAEFNAVNQLWIS